MSARRTTKKRIRQPRGTRSPGTFKGKKRRKKVTTKPGERAAKKRKKVTGRGRSDTRKRIVDAARDLFLRQGFEATSVAQILEAARARSGSFYYFFDSKDDLLVAVLESYKELLWPMVIEPVFDRISDPIERVFGVLYGYRQMLLQSGFSMGCPVGNLAIEVSESHPRARELIAANFTGWQDAIAQCFDEAADRLSPDVNCHALALFVLNTMEGAVMLARAYRDIAAYDTAVGQLRDYINRLLKQYPRSGSGTERNW